MECAFCHGRDEDDITEELLVKEGVTAHVNCMLFSSNLATQDPQNQENFVGFRLEDVKAEIRRGRRLKCSYCKKPGASVGCEVPSCRRSYHYPCAVKDGAKIVEEGPMHIIYCKEHAKEKGTLKNKKKRQKNANSREDSNRTRTESIPMELEDTQVMERDANSGDDSERTQIESDDEDTGQSLPSVNPRDPGCPPLLNQTQLRQVSAPEAQTSFFSNMRAFPLKRCSVKLQSLSVQTTPSPAAERCTSTSSSQNLLHSLSPGTHMPQSASILSLLDSPGPSPTPSDVSESSHNILPPSTSIEPSHDAPPTSPSIDPSHNALPPSPSTDPSHNALPPSPSTDPSHNAPPPSPSIDLSHNALPTSPSSELSHAALPLSTSIDPSHDAPPTSPSIDLSHNALPPSPSTDPSHNALPPSPSIDLSHNALPPSPSTDPSHNALPPSPSIDLSHNALPTSPSSELSHAALPLSTSIDPSHDAPPTSPSIDLSHNALPPSPSTDPSHNALPPSPSTDPSHNALPPSPSIDLSHNALPPSPSSDLSHNASCASPLAEVREPGEGGPSPYQANCPNKGPTLCKCSDVVQSEMHKMNQYLDSINSSLRTLVERLGQMAPPGTTLDCSAVSVPPPTVTEPLASSSCGTARCPRQSLKKSGRKRRRINPVPDALAKQ
ncbi:uncharacterized protein LOC102357403 isoform X2 [Latimeria chalumnae]|uniref:uncharacterized protein LOC102357403 isoform X2 n=1 Tax=Latimeria chalumnae TaxID=7897 RepID=UPI00313D5EB5